MILSQISELSEKKVSLIFTLDVCNVIIIYFLKYPPTESHPAKVLVRDLQESSSFPWFIYPGRFHTSGLAARQGKRLRAGMVICLSGDFLAGPTKFTKADF